MVGVFHDKPVTELEVGMMVIFDDVATHVAEIKSTRRGKLKLRLDSGERVLLDPTASVMASDSGLF